MALGQVQLLALCTLVAVQTLVAVIYRLAQRDGGYPFAPLSALAMAELGKLAISLVLHVRASRDSAVGDAAGGGGRSGGSGEHPLAFVQQPAFRAHLPKFAVLALLYFINNQLAFKLFLWADPTSINLLKSGAIAVSALLWTLFFRRPIAPLQWASIAMQICGMVIVQYDQCTQHTLLALPVYGALFIAVFITALCGVWNELQLKSLPLSIHEQNAGLYAVGFALNLAGYVAQRIADPAYPGFFQGYWGVGILVVLLNSVIGVVVTAVYKYADALVKTLASALTTIVILFTTAALFRTPLTVSIVLGSAVVVLATVMYLSLDTPPPPRVAAATPPQDDAAAAAEMGDAAGIAKAAPQLLQSWTSAWTSGLLSRRPRHLVALLAFVGTVALLVALAVSRRPQRLLSSMPTAPTAAWTPPPVPVVPAVDASLLCIHFTHVPDGPTAARLPPFLASCVANGLVCSTATDATIGFTFIYRGYVRRRLADSMWVTASDMRACPLESAAYETVYEFAIDLLDDSTYTHQAVAGTAAAYFKTSRSTELLERFDPASLPGNENVPILVRRSGRKFMEERQAGYRIYRDRLFPIPLRKAAPPGLNPDLGSYQRRAVLLTMSYHVASNDMAPERIRLYQALRAIAPAWQDIDLHVIDSGNKTGSSSSLLYGSPRLVERDPGVAREYFRFVGESYFMLNLPGIWASQPYRLYDACYADTAVVSTHIYADTARGFPHYPLRGSDPMRGYLNTTLLEAEVRFLLSNYLAIFADLIVAQRDWCETNMSDLAYLHHILRHIPGQPFGPTLRDRSASLYRQFY